MKLSRKYLGLDMVLLTCAVFILFLVSSESTGKIIVSNLESFVISALSITLPGSQFYHVTSVCLLILFLILYARRIIGSALIRKQLQYDLMNLRAEDGAAKIIGRVAKSRTLENKRPQSQDSLKKHISLPQNGLLVVSKGIIVFADKSFFKLTGFDPELTIGKDFASIVTPEYLIDYTLMKRWNESQLPGIRFLKIWNEKEKSFFAEIREEPNARFNKYGLNFFVISDSVASENSAKTAHKIYYNAFENASTPFWIWDNQGLIYINKSGRDAYAGSLDKLIDKPSLLLKMVIKEMRPSVNSRLKNFNTSGKFSEEVCCLIGGETTWYTINLTLFKDPFTDEIAYHGLATDITASKRKLQTAVEKMEKAMQANRNKSAFLANMSHEIRSPLNGIIGFSELLSDQSLNYLERERYMTIIQRNGEALVKLLSDLIDISKLESGKLEIINREFNPSQLLEELKMQFHETHKEKLDQGITLKLNNWKVYQDLEISSDSFRLRQVLINLISNAIKYTSEGTIELGMDFAYDKMLFWVKDTGQGIPEHKKQVIFDRFVQLNNVKKDSPNSGFGLGLSISYSLVELLGGNIWMESIPGKGSLFQFTINTNISNHNDMEINHFNNLFPYNFRERTILIAEDIDFSFLYLEALLKRTGANILWAQNGKDAIEFVKSNHDIDLVLMDMYMPVMTGYEAAAAISRIRPELPIIAQTAYALPDEMKRCYDSGCIGFLAKPIRKEQLLNTLSEYFERIDKKITMQPDFQSRVG